MNRTLWDVARTINTMGVQSSVKLDPTQITKRIKNKLVRWLEAAHIEGGYQSEARKIGMLLVEKYDLPVSSSSFRGMYLQAASPEAATQLTELVTADWLAFILENPHYNSHDSWQRKEHDKVMQWLDNTRTGGVYMSLRNDEFKKQAAEVVRNNLSDDGRAKVRQVIEMLHGAEPVDLLTYRS